MASSQTADVALMRGLNEQTVLGLIREKGPISRAELARRSQLSRSTVSSIIASLLSANYVRETGIGHSQGGRRPIMLDFNYQSSYVIGIDISTTALTLLLTDLQAHVLYRRHAPLHLESGLEQCIPQIIACVHDMIGIAGISKGRISGIGIGIPGPLSVATSRTIAPPIMPGWHGVPIKALLEHSIGIRVFLENDANLGVLAEQTWGAARGKRHIAYIYLGATGVGGGLILNDRLYRGNVGSAGEIGHLTIDEDGPSCRCGSKGCLEAVIGAPALIDRAQRSGLAIRTTEELVGAALAGDPCANALVAEAGEHLGVAVASLLNLLNPSCVVIGGKLAATGNVLLEPLRATLQRRGLTVAADDVELLSGMLGDDVIALGAASVAIQHAIETPAASLVQATGTTSARELISVF